MLCAFIENENFQNKSHTATVARYMLDAEIKDDTISKGYGLNIFLI